VLSGQIFRTCVRCSTTANSAVKCGRRERNPPTSLLSPRMSILSDDLQIGGRWRHTTGSIRRALLSLQPGSCSSMAGEGKSPHLRRRCAPRKLRRAQVHRNGIAADMADPGQKLQVPRQWGQEWWQWWGCWATYCSSSSTDTDRWVPTLQQALGELWMRQWHEACKAMQGQTCSRRCRRRWRRSRSESNVPRRRQPPRLAQRRFN